MDKRLIALSAWIRAELDAEIELKPASADASFRRYYRFTAGDESLIAMDAPPEREDIHGFIRTATRLYELGLNVPRVLRLDHARGFLLLTDLGTDTYLSRLNENTVERLYGDALGALAVLQAGTVTDPEYFPAYDRGTLMREMTLFPQWYIGRHLGRQLTPAQEAIIDQTFDRLCDSALEQPQVWVHRDYHSRNLMLSREHNPGILDFQDAVTGPVTYDLVSLLRDCYIEWPRRRVLDWAIGYHALANQCGIQVGDDTDLFLRWFDLMGLQRHIKVLGIFARLFHRDGKPHYLPDLPLVWKYALQVCADYAQLHPFHDLLLELEPPQCTH